jgi:HK97 family phage prohead protease
MKGDPMTSAPTRAVEHKVVGLDVANLKAGPDRTFTGYASLVGATDYYHDVVQRGCFADTLAARPSSRRPLLWNHDAGQPIGAELSLAEDGYGLKGTWRLASTGLADEVYSLIKDGTVSGLSIGFLPTDRRPNDRGGYDLHAVELLEVSVVSMPALDDARITNVKSRGGAPMPAAPARPTDLGDVRSRLSRLGVDVTTATSAGGSLGRRVAASRELKQVADRRAESARVTTDLTLKALLVPPSAAGELYGVPRPSGALPGAASYLPVVQTASGAADIPQASYPTGALAVAVAVAATGVSGLKPEVTVAYGPPRQVPLVTVAGYISASTRALADGELLAALIDGDLRIAVADALDREVLSGTGTAPSMLGIANWPGINAVTGTGLAALLKGLAIATTVGRRPATICFCSLGSWAALVSDPTVVQALGPELLLPGGCPIVPTAGLVDGQALVGAASTAPLFSRGGVSVELGFHGQNFVRNITTLRGEVDAAVGVTLPAAWAKITGLAVAPAEG